MADQVTIKVHKFVKEYAIDIMDQLYFKKKGGGKWSESAFYAIAMLRLKQEFDNVDWKKEREVNKFIEGLLNDIYYLQKKGIISVKMRNIPQK